jgi:transcriptional regulator with XRE-family HTH domain
MVFNPRSCRAVKQPRLHLSERFPDLVARTGYSQRAFARTAGVSHSTIMGLLHPKLHPGRRGGMQRRTAWRIAQAYATIARIDPEKAFRLLIVERPVGPTTDTATAFRSEEEQSPYQP